MDFSLSEEEKAIRDTARAFIHKEVEPLEQEVLRRERPSLVVSAGAGVAVPFFAVAWMMRIPTVFIEVYDRVDTPTMSGRLCGPFTTRRIVQWKSQLAFYPDARLVGPLL